MTVKVTLSGEKPTPPPQTKTPAASGSILETVRRWYINSYFKSNDGKAKVAEIIFGLMATIFLITCHWLTITEYVFLFVAFNGTLLTAIVLWDNVNGGKLRNLLVVSIRVDQRYNAIVALLFYIFAFFELAVAGSYYEPGSKIAAGVTGMLASIAYAYNWWLLYRERLLEGMIAAKVDEFNQQEQKQRSGLVQDV
ncbi:uncharacterized protein LOC129778322 [Toxorhynchites rutilus septentrionalis]|uniref:uncharacterized protein LOC129778322 n=1 Tax=Toxorhynchites rutilus septentrionalis TaxID=329112 RepID=UPI00247A923B|nr:uncharacterized protein LOC129778322 [Toxorhynchites rutilus septentrionalis]